MKHIARLLQLTLSDWRYLIKASGELLGARFRLSTVPAEKILRDLQTPLAISQDPKLDCSPLLNIERLSWAIRIASRYVPWRSDCLVQAMAADRWMRQHALITEFYLVVAKEPPNSLTAHAWLRYGDFTLTGGNSAKFSILIKPPMK